MWQDAKEIITRRMRAIAGFTPLDICFLFSLYCLKGLSNGVNLHSAIVCVLTNKACILYAQKEIANRL